MNRRSRLCDELSERSGRWAALAQAHGTPLLVLEPHLAARRFRQLQKILPDVGLHYAVKALPHPVVLSTIAICGGGFNVGTRGEIELLQQLGLPMHRCIHTNPVKKPAEIDHAYEAGIRTFVVENDCEVQKFVGRPADTELLVRLAFRNTATRSEVSAKFGAELSDAELLVKQVLAAGVQFAGFTFHVRNQGPSTAAFRDALRKTVDLVAHLRDSLGVPTRVIDIGGGFPVGHGEPRPSIDAVAAVVDDVLGPPSARERFTLLAEPGRFLAADCMTLLTSVVGTAVRDGRVWHYLDDGVYGSYSNALTREGRPQILALSELAGPKRRLEPVTLAGPTSDSADVVARDHPMPALEVGDIVVSPMMGAYTSATSSRFNGIPVTPIVMS